MRIRAVVFDLFITLTDFEAERRRPQCMEELANALGVEPAAFASLMRTTFTERATGKLGDARATLSELASRLDGYPPTDQLDRVVALRYEQTRQSVVPRAGVLDVLSELRGAGYVIGILTDCTAEIPELWPSLPYAAVVETVTFSCEIGSRKPQPAGYADIAQKLGAAPEECLYVGDGSSGELTGATAAGMTAVLVETPFGTDFRFDAEEWTGRSIAELSDLKGVLREL